MEDLSLKEVCRSSLWIERNRDSCTTHEIAKLEETDENYEKAGQFSRPEGMVCRKGRKEKKKLSRNVSKKTG